MALNGRFCADVPLSNYSRYSALEIFIIVTTTRHKCRHQQVPLSCASCRATLAVVQFGAQPTRNLRDWTSPASMIIDIRLASREVSRGTTLRWTREPITGCSDTFPSTKPLGIFICSASITLDSFGFEISLRSSDAAASSLPAAIKVDKILDLIKHKLNAIKIQRTTYFKSQ